MIVYIESNFVLELALQQEQAAPAEAIVLLAEQGAIDLVIPGFAVSEPLTTLLHYGDQRRTVIDAVEKEIVQLRRAPRHHALIRDLNGIIESLTKIEDDDTEALNQTLDRLLHAGRVAELDGPTFRQARLYSDRYELRPKDATIYATIVADLAQQPAEQPKCFTSRDAKAFLDPSIKTELASYNCRVITSFDQALSYIQSAVDTAN